jgi:O-antigen/teichoic acid export membrane protein
MSSEPLTTDASRTGPPSLVRSTALSFADTAITLTSAVIVSVVLARMLGPVRYGVYALVMTIVIFFQLLSRLGIGETVRRYVAELDGRAERAVAAVVAGRGLVYALIAGSTAAVILALAASPLAVFFRQPELRGYLLIGAAILVPMLAASVLRNVLRGIQQYQYFVRMNLVISPLWVAACLLVIVLGGGITGLLIVGLALELLSLVVFGWWTRREVGIRLGLTLPPGLAHRMVRYNFALAGLVVLNSVIWQRSELLFLGRFSGSQQVAFYNVPFALTGSLAALVPGPLLGVLLPSLTYARGAADPARFAALLNMALRYLAMLTIPICLFGIPLAGAIIQVLYGQQFAPAAVVLQILFLSVVFAVLGDAASSTLLGEESQGWLLKTGAIAAAGSLLLDLLLIPPFGSVGAAIANTVAQGGWALAAFLPLIRRVTRETWVVIARQAALAGVIGSGLAFITLVRAPTPALVAAGLIALLLYVFGLDRLRLLSVRSLLAQVRPHA